MHLIFEWDERKASANIQKHGVNFEEAKTVFADVDLVTFLDGIHSQYENRFVSIGISASSRLLLVVHTEAETEADQIVIRLISARKATRKEAEIYAKE